MSHPRTPYQQQTTNNEQPVARLLTPPGRGGIAVIQLSGQGAQEVLSRVFRPLRSHAAAGPGTLQLGKIIGEDAAVVDEAVVCPTACGVEINIHGGPQAVRSTLELLGRHGVLLAAGPPCGTGGFDPACPGLDNPAIGREMLQALPAAESLLAVVALTSQWSAGLSRLARQAIECLSTTGKTRSTEAGDASSAGGLKDLAEALRQAAGALPRLARLIRPAEVVIVGPPNTGKSTLMNAMVGRAVSIVHERAGTTRDWVRELALIDQVPVHLTDTAGLWQQAEGIDAEAVDRARRCAEQADIVLLAESVEGGEFAFPPWAAGLCVIVVRTKADLLSQTEPGAVECPRKAFRGLCSNAEHVDEALNVSALTGEGMPLLRHAILRSLGLEGFDPAAAMAFTARQAGLLEQAARALDEGKPDDARQNLGDLLTDQSSLPPVAIDSPHAAFNGQ